MLYCSIARSKAFKSRTVLLSELWNSMHTYPVIKIKTQTNNYTVFQFNPQDNSQNYKCFVCIPDENERWQETFWTPEEIKWLSVRTVS